MEKKPAYQLEENLWIADGYYIDFDSFGQLRIIGPNNHLYCGLVDIPPHKIKIKNIYTLNHHLQIEAKFTSPKINLYYPIMEDIRTLRELIGDISISFLQLRYKVLGRAFPRIIKRTNTKTEKKIIFKKPYGDFFYQTEFIFPKNIKIRKINRPLLGFEISLNNKPPKTSSKKSKEIEFKIIATTNEINYKSFKHFFLYLAEDLDYKVFGKYKKNVKEIMKRTEIEIEHLISWNKTSGDRFGTVFPRDWMESAVIGIHDLRPEVIKYMYEASLKNVNRKGEGWHEDVIGEYKYEHQISGRDIFDRKMIDIEPNYIIGLNYLPEDFLAKKENNQKMRLVAKYILNEAEKKDFITFKKIPPELKESNEEYYSMGNWRDSEWAFKKIHPIIAPFDVNCVFYPKALKTIKNFKEKLGLESKKKKIEKLIEKWESKKEDYKFYNEDGKIAYALALYDIQGKKSFKKMEVNHLDEAYLFTYLDATKEEVKSFCERLLSEKYFYTPSGPTIIARNNKYGYTPEEYHGTVIWTKQTAFCVLGLSRHLKKALSENWPKSLQKLIKNTLLKICEDAIRTFSILKSVPEVHIDKNGKPELFGEKFASYKMSKVQLWSAVGARRIIRKYYELKTDPAYKET